MLYRFLLFAENIFHIGGWVLAVVFGFRSAPALFSIAICTAVLEMGYICGAIPKLIALWRDRRWISNSIVMLSQVLMWVFFSTLGYLIGKGIALIIHSLF